MEITIPNRILSNLTDKSRLKATVPKDPSVLIHQLLKDHGPVDKWTLMRQAWVLITAIDYLADLPKNSAEGMWVETLHAIFYSWSQIDNSGIVQKSSKGHEDSRGLDETSDTVYSAGNSTLHFHNYQHWTQRGLDDETWSVTLNR